MATGSSVSDLSITEKLALKGQLFELRKKLNAIELKNQQVEKETYSFQPELVTDYVLTDRDQDYAENVRRAEIIRTQKLDMLKASVEMEYNAELSFSPSINNKSRRLAQKSVQRNGLPTDAGSRLYDQARFFKEKKERQAEEISLYDSQTGQKLFAPLISSKSKAIVPTSTNDLSAHEFMYRDAVDREQRLRQAEANAREQIERSASSLKLNAHSDRVLKKKAERETRALYEWLNSDSSGTLTFEQVTRGASELAEHNLIRVDVASGESYHKIAEQVWEILQKQTSLDSNHPYNQSQTKVTLDIFRTSGEEDTPLEAERKQGLTGQTCGVQSFTQKVLPIMARAYLGAHFDRRANYDTTVDTNSIVKSKVASANVSISSVETPAGMSIPSTPPRSPYHIPRKGGVTATSSSAVKASPTQIKHKVVLRSDFPKSLITAKTAAIPVKKAELGSTPNTPSNKSLANTNVQKSLNSQMDKSFVSEDGEERPVQLNDIPVHGKISNLANKNYAPVINNQNEAAVPSSYAVFKRFVTAGMSLLKTKGHKFGKNVDLSRIRNKTKAEAEKESMKRTDASFTPRIPDSSKKLAMSREEKEIADLLQNVLEEEDEAAAEEFHTPSKNYTKQELMDERNRQSIQKKEATRMRVLDEQMKECTFQPLITTRQVQKKNPTIPKEAVASVDELDETVDNRSVTSLGQIYEYDKNTPAYERLYAMKDKAPRSNRIVYKTKEEIDFEGCTFQPKLNTYVPEPTLKEKNIIVDAEGNTATVLIPVNPKVRPPGWKESVERLRNAAAMRKPEEVVEDEQYDDLEKRYKESKRVFAEGTKEFVFKGEQRSKERATRKATHGNARMFVDVKLSAYKTANIPVYEGDSPAELADSFCKIYALPIQAVAVLEEVIRQSMDDNDVAIASSDSEDEDPAIGGRTVTNEKDSYDEESVPEPNEIAISETDLNKVTPHLELNIGDVDNRGISQKGKRTGKRPNQTNRTLILSPLASTEQNMDSDGGGTPEGSFWVSTSDV